MIAFKIGNKENVGLHPADVRFDLLSKHRITFSEEVIVISRKNVCWDVNVEQHLNKKNTHLVQQLLIYIYKSKILLT